MIAAAACLFASELMVMFEFTPPGRRGALRPGRGRPTQQRADGDRRFAIVGTLVAVYGGSRPAAFAVAGMGVLALLIFLISDLRVANAAGSLSEACGASQGFLFEAEAVPKGGFYMELLGALALTVTGLALATLTPEQLVRCDRAGARARPRRAIRIRPPEAQGRRAGRGAAEQARPHGRGSAAEHRQPVGALGKEAGSVAS